MNSGCSRNYEQFSITVVLTLSCASESLGGLVAKQIAGPIPGVSDAVDLRRGREFTLLNRFPGDAAGGPLKTTALLHFLAAWPLV